MISGKEESFTNAINNILEQIKKVEGVSNKNPSQNKLRKIALDSVGNLSLFDPENRDDVLSILGSLRTQVLEDIQTHSMIRKVAKGKNIKDKYKDPVYAEINAETLNIQIDFQKDAPIINQLEELYHKIITAMIKAENLLFERLLDKGTQKEFNEFSPMAVAKLRQPIAGDNVPMSLFLDSYSFFPSMIRNKDFGPIFDPAYKYEEVLSGNVGKMIGLDVITDAYLHPEQKIFSDKENRIPRVAIFSNLEIEFEGEYNFEFNEKILQVSAKLKLTLPSFEKVACVARIREDEEMSEESYNPIMKFFNYEHLPEHLQEVSKPVGELAQQMDKMLPDGPEKSAGLRKLLEAKDCFVRTQVK